MSFGPNCPFDRQQAANYFLNTAVPLGHRQKKVIPKKKLYLTKKC
jgi:hypothetical protein